MVVATVIVQIAFGLHSQPPGGVWSETKENQPDQCPITNGVCHVGTSVMAASTENNRLIYLSFRSYNSTALIGSMCVILMLISGIPLENKPFHLGFDCYCLYHTCFFDQCIRSHSYDDDTCLKLELSGIITYYKEFMTTFYVPFNIFLIYISSYFFVLFY